MTADHPAYAGLTEAERVIADQLGNSLDMIARLITGPISAGYFYEKLPIALASLTTAARAAGIDPTAEDTQPEHVVPSRRSWDVNRTWDALVRHYSHAAPSLDQLWTALEYPNPRFIADNRLSTNRPYFTQRPPSLDDTRSTDWHVQYLPQGADLYRNTVIKGRSAGDAVRNAYYAHPEATDCRIDLTQHDDEEW